MSESNVTVVIVSFNTREKLRRCLSAIEAHHEVVVVDNASTDGSADMVESHFAHARLIRNERNLGFGGANNLGMDLSTRDRVLFINSDCYASPGSIDRLSEVFVDPKVVAAGGELHNLDGSLQESVAGDLKLKSVFLEQTYLDALVRRVNPRWSYWRTRWALSEAKAKGDAVVVPQVMGACLMMRKLERFDERYFLYCEDTDLCLRLRRHGKILYRPGAVFIHELGSSSIGARWKSVARYNYGKELYFRLHYGQMQSVACLLLDRLGALLRLAIWLVLLQPKRAGLFWRVLTCPLSGPSGS